MAFHLTNQTTFGLPPSGDIYFSDPVYRGELQQDGEHVYYIPPEQDKVIRVIDDLIRPNGIIGTPDGSTLYVSDHGGQKTCRYTINSDGSLKNRQLFAAIGSDGITMDEQGNIYLTNEEVLVYNSTGEKIEEITVDGEPTNVCFGGTNGEQLFITTRNAVFTYSEIE